MSKIGNQIIQIPSGVTVTIGDRVVEVKGPKGNLNQPIPANIAVSQEGEQLTVTRANDGDQAKAFHGLARMLIYNMVVGVTTGWNKQLELVGTGYRAANQGQDLSLSVGYSHPVVIQPPAGVSFKLDGQTKILVEGIDKQAVTQMAAKIRAVRPPEPYKGKGVRYVDEKIRCKPGKTAGGGTK